MKKKLGRVASVLLVAAVCALAVWIGTAYFDFISQRIYKDSTDHLQEIYGQVNRSFSSFTNRNWGLLKSWGSYLAQAEGQEEAVADYLEAERESWGFSQFYFLSRDGACLSAQGERSSLELEGAWEGSLRAGRPVMAGETLPDGQEVVVFAALTSPGTYQGFSYQAIAVSYTNEALSRSLNVDAFSGKAKCFVIRGDGSVLLSAQPGGSVYNNYLVYLRAVSDLGEADLARIQGDWAAGRSGLLQCQVRGVNYCVLYQPVGYQDYTLLSAVPQSVVSAGFLSVQQATTTVLILIFLLLGVTAVVLLILRSRRQSLRSKAELQYRERMFDVLSNTVDDIFIMMDTQGREVNYISPNIERLMGIPVEEAEADLRVMERCAVDGDVTIPKEELEAIPLHGSRGWECEYMHQTTGERRWYRLTVYRMQIQEVEKYIFVLSDRTLERQMNHQLQEALDAAQSANEAKSNFLSNMSHDIRTPMNAIVGLSVLLEKDADKPEKVREYTHKITASSHHLLSLINDVLDMSKIESGKTSLNVDRFRLPEVLEELNFILLPQARAKRQTFEIRTQGTVPEQLMGDKLRLNQILLNLLSNAVKYTPEEGRIEFLVQGLEAPAPQYAKLRFVVRDNGIGMDPDYLAEIFDPFSREVNSVTNTVQGTGLGMAITKNLVDLMGGIIQVESQLGEGSTFTVELTFVLPEQEHAATGAHGKVTRMLVADDEEDVCLAVRELMRDTGVDVAYATDGAAAVERAVGAHREGLDFHVILLDWKMPGMDGVETARAIRREVGAGVPILVLTSYDWSEIEEEARRAGIDAFMPKPFFVSTFWQTIAPFFPDDEAAEAPASAPSERVMEGRRFLVAEDNELNAEIMVEMLKMEGAACELAVNGQEAVERFTAAQPGHYDLILMDVQMPVMNGYDATRAIRASRHPEAGTIPIVALTANTFAEDVRNALDAGMDGHLAKPVDMDEMRALVGRLLRARGAEETGTEKKEDAP